VHLLDGNVMDTAGWLLRPLWIEFRVLREDKSIGSKGGLYAVMRRTLKSQPPPAIMVAVGLPGGSAGRPEPPFFPGTRIPIRRLIKGKEAMASRDSQVEDLKCVAAVKGGRPDAFGDVVKRYQDRIFNTIYRLLGDYQEAGDLTQQAFLKAYLSLNQFRGGSTFYTWLYRIGVNTALDERKRRSRTPQVLSETFIMSPDEDARRLDGSAASDDPGEMVLSRERETAVAQAIASLDDVHRTVLVLRDIEGLDYEEIAQVAACPRGTVKSRLHRARLMLREKLKGFVQ